MDHFQHNFPGIEDHNSSNNNNNNNTNHEQQHQEQHQQHPNQQHPHQQHHQHHHQFTAQHQLRQHQEQQEQQGQHQQQHLQQQHPQNGNNYEYVILQSQLAAAQAAVQQQEQSQSRHNQFLDSFTAAAVAAAAGGGGGAVPAVPPVPQQQHPHHLYHDPTSHSTTTSIANNYPGVVALPATAAATTTPDAQGAATTTTTAATLRDQASPAAASVAEDSVLLEDRQRTIQEATWQIMLRSLADWMVRNLGDKRGPTMQDDPELASWVREQRANMAIQLQQHQVEIGAANKKLRRKQQQIQLQQQQKEVVFEKRYIDQLNAIHFDWTETEFDIMFRQLQQFKSNHGTVDVPVNCDDRELLRWVQVQRENKARLDSIGFNWGSGSEGFSSNNHNNNRKNNNDAGENESEGDPKRKQPFGYSASTTTANANKRNPIATPKKTQVAGTTAPSDSNSPKRRRILVQEYQQMHNPAQGLQIKNEPVGAAEGSENGDVVSKNDTTTDDKQIGTGDADTSNDWGGGEDDDDDDDGGNSNDEEIILAAPVSFKKNWDELFRRLVKFKKDYGHLKVPADFHDQPLVRWVDRQRKLLKAQPNQFNPSLLTPAEQHRLKSIGLDQTLDMKASNWKVNYQMLLEFKKEHGHCNVTRRKGVDNRLAMWIDTQRRFRKLGKLSAERVQKLEEVCFDWNAFAEKWEFMFSKLTSFQETHGHCRVPQRHRHDGNLGEWVRTQRRFRKSGKLAQDKVDRLEALGFEWEVNHGPQPRSSSGSAVSASNNNTNNKTNNGLSDEEGGQSETGIPEGVANASVYK